MKNKHQTMIKTFAIVVAVMASSAAFGQSRIQTPIVSKDVQRIGLSKSFFIPARIVTTNYPISSKSVQLVGYRYSEPAVAPVKTTGMPSHVISKGVARMQYERRFKK